MQRRTLLFTLAILSGNLIFGRQARGAQPPEVVFLTQFIDPQSQFLDELRRLGYVEGVNIRVTTILAPTSDLFEARANEAVARNPAVIVTIATELALSAKKATQTIPIVASSVSDPIGSGLVENLAHPGGNLTATSSLTGDLAPKQLSILKEAVPSLKRVAMLVRLDNRTNLRQAASAASASGPLGIVVTPLATSVTDDIVKIIASVKDQGFDALFVPRDPYFGRMHQPIAEAAIKYHLPTISATPAAAAAGVLCAYGADTEPNLRLAAQLTHRILRGDKPGDLPVEQPTKLRFIVNLKTAKALGLDMPVSIIAQADEVIE